ncbi:transporter substrate-binding domain-containing protein [Paraglaciecola aquimarina]|uniref:Transporter substrate-binding domain-containing protein n=1 Tax=Paraglaciecola algarum TaxID=3050085 RepID=A0ABS9D3X3_9ALTE|nr:transporter substrate-binding domain-containing protein [Paraglaciecola sp. G1-23]MCF2947638.1 transporter substrate-binding domain-containing protein [Paraglaciecola sp. G1-23]
MILRVVWERNKYLLFLGSLLSSCFFGVLHAKQDISLTDFSYYTEHYPPSNYIENNELTGMSVELIKLIWQELDIPEQTIQLVPWARGYRITQSQKHSVLFTMARAKEREHLFKWVGPIYTARHILLARADFKHPIRSIEDAYEFPIAAIRNDISEVALLEVGFPKNNIAPLTNLKQSILMLENGRLDLIIISQASIKNLIESNNLELDDFKMVYQVNEVKNYYAFSKDTPDPVITLFQHALDNIDAQRIKLLKKYSLELDFQISKDF